MQAAFRVASIICNASVLRDGAGRDELWSFVVARAVSCWRSLPAGMVGTPVPGYVEVFIGQQPGCRVVIAHYLVVYTGGGSSRSFIPG